MNQPPRFLRPAATCAFLALFAGLAGCQQDPPKPKLPTYPVIDTRPVPPFMNGSIYQITNLQNDQPFVVSGWGLVVNLQGTGGSTQVSNNVKAYMAKEMERKGFGSKLRPEYEHISPEAVINDRNAAIVAVYGWIPPGARKGQMFDIALKAEALEATSLARGTLYDCDLTIDGANPQNPFRKVNVWATAYGPVFVNPAVALNFNPVTAGAAQKTLRTGTIIGGGRVTSDRPLLLRIRQPERRMARAIEQRVGQVFHVDRVCTAYDEAYCQLWVPPQFEGDWDHFAKLVQHIYVQGGSEAFSRAKAKELVVEAKKPGAPLQDISYCWEGLGSIAMPDIAPLLVDGPEDVRFAAARAAAYIGDPSGAAERTLYDIARTSHSSFQLAAVQVLGRIPNTRAINQLLRDLLDADETTVRIEAYNILARAGDPSIQSQVIGFSGQSTRQKFILDFVNSHGKPLLYATRSGVPRLAIFGSVPELTLPLTFSALDNCLTISSQPVGRDVTIFYRSAQLKRPVLMASPPDVADIVARLAGQMDDGTGRLDFTYAEILAILQGMSDQHKLQVTAPTGESLAAAFMLQEATDVRDAIDSAPLLDRGRPQGDNNSGPALDAPPAPAGSPPDRAANAQDPNAAPAAVNSAATIGRQ